MKPIRYENTFFVATTQRVAAGVDDGINAPSTFELFGAGIKRSWVVSSEGTTKANKRLLTIR